MPYDHVEVRKSPGYNARESVSVRGEVLFDGSYVLQKRNERLTDIIKRAGGILDEAYIKGAYLTRRLSEDELASRREVLRLAMANSGPGMGDSIALSKINVSPTYNVGINLEGYPESRLALRRRASARRRAIHPRTAEYSQDSRRRDVPQHRSIRAW